MAIGILPIALGEATKTVPFPMDAALRLYRFTIAWGATTTGFDREGEIVATSDVRPSRAEVEGALPAFLGAIEQVPPMFSALMVDGERAYDLAREGVEVELEPRTVTIHGEWRSSSRPDADHIELDAVAQRRLRPRRGPRPGRRAGACSHVSALRRTAVGLTHRGSGDKPESWKNCATAASRLEALLPVVTALDDIPALAMTTEDAFRLTQGRSIVLLPRQAEALKARLISRLADRRRIRGREDRGALRDTRGTAQPHAGLPSHLSGDCPMSITAERKGDLIRTHARGEADTGFAEVQVAILSERIANLTEHFKTHKEGQPLAPGPAEASFRTPVVVRPPEDVRRGPLHGADRNAGPASLGLCSLQS